MSVRMPTELREKLERVATDLRRKPSEMVRIIVEDYLASNRPGMRAK
jgi:predicted DNA-binding protein